MNKAEIALLQRSVRRKICPEDIQAIAELCAMRLTEKEACCHLGIGYDAWNMFKQRNGNQAHFVELLSRVRSSKVQGLVREIEKHGHGDQKRGIRADWRALDRVLTITDQRYSDRAPQGPGIETDALADSLLSRMLERAYQQTPQAQEAQVVDVTEAAPVQASGMEGEGI